MKIEDIKFLATGCCGEYQNATVELSDGRIAVITDNQDGNYTVAILKSGKLEGGLIGMDAVAVEQLINS